MFSETVAQNPTTPVSEGTKKRKNSPKVWNFEGVASMGPKPPAFFRAQSNKANPMSKRNSRAVVKVGPARRQGHDHGIDGFAADPGLNAEPAAGDQGAQDRGDISAENAKGSAGKNWKRDAVAGACVGVQKHGDQNQHVAEKDGEERLLPVHPAGNHAAGKHVGGDVHAHGNP